MRLYHNTFPDAAAAIMQDGFRDGISPDLGSGVFLAEVPTIYGPSLIVVEAPEESLAPHEVHYTATRPYREWLIPAELVNQWPRHLEVQ